MRNSFRPMVEVLGDRILPAGGVLLSDPMPLMQFEIEQIRTPGILPGALGQPIAGYRLTNESHSPVRFTGLTTVPASGLIGRNTWEVILRADSNRIPGDGPRGDGYENDIGRGRADQFTDVVDIAVNQPIWINNSEPLQVLMVANFYSFLDGNSIGVFPAQARFTDLSGVTVPQAQVSYTGIAPVRQPMHTGVLQVSQNTQVPALVDVSAGTGGVELFKFNAYSNIETSMGVAFVVHRGSFENAVNYRMIHRGYNGVQDDVVHGFMYNGKLVFLSENQVYQTGTWTVVADIQQAENLTEDPRIQIAFDAGLSGFGAIDKATGSRLLGLMVNGTSLIPGQGSQNQMYAFPDGATEYVISSAPLALSVSLSPNSPGNQTVAGNQTVVGASFVVSATGDSQTLHEAVFTVPAGGEMAIRYISLWDGVTLVGITDFNSFTRDFSFTWLNISVPAGVSKTLTVKLELAEPPFPVNTKMTLRSLGFVNDDGLEGVQHPAISSNDLFVLGADGQDNRG